MALTIDDDLPGRKRTAVDRQGDGVAHFAQGAKAGTGGPKQPIVALGLRVEAEAARYEVGGEARECVDQLPGRHRAGVVRAAFDVVPRITLRAVVAVARGADDV